MDFTILWAAIVGTLIPLAVAFVANCNWSSAAKSWTAFGSSVVVGVVTVYVAGGLDAANLTATTLAIYGACEGAYKIWKRYGITNNVLENLGNTVK